MFYASFTRLPSWLPVKAHLERRIAASSWASVVEFHFEHFIEVPYEGGCAHSGSGKPRVSSE